MHTLLNARCGSFRHTQQFDAIAQFIGHFQIQRGNGLNALDIDRARINLGSKGQARQQSQFMCRIKPTDIKSRVSLGITQSLRVRETGIISEALKLHARQHIIAGAVQYAGNTRNAVSGHGFAQSFNDRNAAGDSGFIIERNRIFFGQCGQCCAVFGKQSLIGRHNRFASLQSRFNR